MSKILLYSAILLTLLTAGLGYWNHSCYQIILSEKKAAIQQQQQEIEKVNQECNSLKEKIASTASTEEQQQKILADAEQARTKAESDLAEAQKQLADKDVEFEQKNKDLLGKEATIQSLMTAQKNVVPAPTPASTTKKKSSKNVTASEKKDPAAPPAGATNVSTLCAPAGGIEGKVAAVNPSWNFVVLNVGENNGVTKDSEMLVQRGGQAIAKVKITSVEPLTSIGDIIPNSVTPGSAVQVGDQVSATFIEAIKK